VKVRVNCFAVSLDGYGAGPRQRVDPRPQHVRPDPGDWRDESWKGGWGENPPYHVPVFVLTHHARKPVEMAGGTTFHFVTGGTEEALRRAREAAGSEVREQASSQGALHVVVEKRASPSTKG